MTDELKAHEFFLEGMKGIPSIEAVKGVARVFDERIGNSIKHRIYIFFPDLHIVSRKKREKRFDYGFNHERLFVDLLKKLLELRSSQSNYEIVVVQMGDFVDLWREKTKDPGKILSDFQGVRDYLYGMPGGESLQASFILGNHDVGIVKVPDMSPYWSFRLFLPDDGPLKTYVTHGDVFDWIEKLPDSLQEWAVYLLTPKTERPVKKFNKLAKLIKKKSQQTDPTRIYQIEALEDVKATGLIDKIPYMKTHKYLESCFERTEEMNRNPNVNLTSAVIAHTHEPAITLLDEGESFFVMMDCGSWQGKYQEPGSDPKANCQIGVICGNDFRIYQLDPDISVSPQFELDKVL